nr:lisH domain-containing protein ARMC9-like isoform X1 [Procambarus clarkii]
MDRGGHKDAAHIHALMVEYLEWAGMEKVCHVLRSECHARGLPVTREPADSRSSSRASRVDTADLEAAGDLEELLDCFDSGQGAKFFQAWRAARERSHSPASLEVLTLEFYFHVYFATLPLRHGHKEDHLAAMAVFRRFLETCPPRVGTVQDLLPFYALPYVPDPTLHPAFRPVFQDPWVHELRGRLCGFLGRRPTTSPRPAIFSYLHRHHHHASSVGAALVAQESAASAVRSQRVLRRRLQRLQEDYHKLIGVSWELTQALEAAVRGERVDLEGTLAACTHRYPELFTLTLTADTTAGPATILLESMQRCRRRPGVSAPVPALDFERVRADLGGAPETHVLLLLQALRHRVTKVTTGSVRQAVVTAYVRGDVLGLRGACRSWTRLATALTTPESQFLPQAAARLINALTAFNAGRTYLASEEVCQVLLQALHADHPHSAATDMVLAALQKLSIRGVVQEALIEGGAVEWLVNTLADLRALTPYTQEYAAALFMNLTLRSSGRARCQPLGATLLPALIQLLTSVQSHVVPYVTGALYSLLSHSGLRQEAFDMGLDSTLERLAQGGSTEQRRQLEYVVEQIRRDPPLSPPPSPDPVLDMEEDPEWLEEELDVDDPVRAPPHAPAGEDLLAWRYTLHPGEAEDAEHRRDMAPARSAPVVPWDPRPYNPNPRPNSDGFVTQLQHRVPQQEQTHQQAQHLQAAGGQWDYPSDTDAGRGAMYTSRSNFTSRSLEVESGTGGGCETGDDGGEGSYREERHGSREGEWSLPLRGLRSPPPTRRHDPQRTHDPQGRQDPDGHQFVPPVAREQGHASEGEEEEEDAGGASPPLTSPGGGHTSRPITTTCPAEDLVPYFTRHPHVHDDHHQNSSSGTSEITQKLILHHDGEEDVTLMSARTPTAEHQPSTLGNSTFRLGGPVHDKIDEESVNVARATNSSQVKSTDVREDLKGTHTAQERPATNSSDPTTNLDSRTSEPERQTEVEAPRGDTKGDLPRREEIKKRIHESVSSPAAAAATAAAAPQRAEARGAAVAGECEGGTQHVVCMSPPEALSQAPRHSSLEPPTEASKEAPKGALSGAHKEALKGASTEASKGASNEAPNVASMETPKGTSNEALKGASKKTHKRMSTEILKVTLSGEPQVASEEQAPQTASMVTLKGASSGASKEVPTGVPEVKMLSRRASVNPARLPPPDPPKGYDLVATRIMQQIVGENRDIPAPSTVPEADPLLRSLPPPKASEYKVAFSSRPRIARTPPGSAAAAERGSPGTAGGVTSSSPRHVLPPISRTNHTYTRAAT